MRTALITGGAGFFGSLLKKHLLDAGVICVSIDLQKDDTLHPNLTAIQGDIRDPALLHSICRDHPFDVVFHCAAILAHAVQDKKFLWSCNVDGTRRVAQAMKEWKIPRIIHQSWKDVNVPGDTKEKNEKDDFVQFKDLIPTWTRLNPG